MLWMPGLWISRQMEDGELDVMCDSGAIVDLESVLVLRSCRYVIL